MNRRLLAVACALLLLSTIGLTGYAWRLRSRIDRAEMYVQSGVESVYFICSPVLRELAVRHEGGPDPGMLRIARQCLGQVSDGDAESTASDFDRKDVTAISERIKAKLDAPELPFKTAGPVEPSKLPQSYKN